jgi:hypothetical protein
VDDVAFAYLPTQRRLRTLLVTRGSTNLDTLLRLDRHVDLQVVTPAAYRERADIDVYIFDRFAPAARPSKPSLVFGAPEASWLRVSDGLISKPEITAWSGDHPIMRFVPFFDVSIERAVRIDPGPATVIARSGSSPLIVASDDPRWVMLTFELNSSDFAQQSAFPVFVENVLGWLAQEPLALRSHPGLVEIPLSDAVVRTDDGRTVVAQHHLGKTLVRLPDPGLYTATSGATRVHLAAQLTNPDLSNINQSTLTGADTMGGGAGLHQDLWWYALLGALLLLAVEWFTFHLRITL